MMNREERNCLSSYVQSLSGRTIQNNSNIALIKYTGVIDVSVAEVAEMLPEGCARRVFYYSFKKNYMEEAYAPFMDIIKQLVCAKDISMEEHIEASGVYALHKAVFESFFNTGRAQRTEEPFFSEVKFEKEMIFKGILNMLLKACDGEDIYLVFDKINYAGASTLEFLEHIICNPACENIRIIAFTNENSKARPHEELYKNKFETHCEELGCAFQWPLISEMEENLTENGFVFNVTDIEEYLTKTYNMYCMYAFTEMRYYLDFIYQKVLIENLSISKAQKVRLCLQLAILAVLQGDCAHALLVAESLRRLSDEINNWKIEFEYYYIIAYVNMHNGNINMAEEAADKCIEIAEANNDEYFYFKGTLARIMSKFSGFYNILISYENYPISEELIEQCKKWDYYNHLAHLYIYCFENDAYADISIETISEKVPYFNKGIAIAEELGNEQLLTDAYRAVIMQASYGGNREIVNYFYEKDIEVAKRRGDRFEEAMVYNGLGYNHCASEDYVNANNYFNLAMKIFHQMGLSDYIIETFYNMAINCIMAEEYDNATLYLEKTLYLLNINKKNSLRVCNISKVMGMIALSTFYQGRVYSTKNYLVQDGQFLDYITDNDADRNNNYLWDDDLFLYYICQALVHNYGGEYEEAMEIYEIAEMYMKRSQGNYFFAYPQYCMAKQYTLYMLGREEERIKLLNDYKKFCNKNGYIKHLQIAIKLIDDPLGFTEHRANNLRCPIMAEVCEAERIRSLEKEAKIRHKEIQFFTLFQNMLDKRESNISDKMTSLLSALASNYNLDGILTIHLEGSKRNIYKERARAIHKNSVEQIIRFFQEKRSGFAISKYSANYKDYRALFSIMFGEKIFSMVGVPIFENEKLTAILVAYTKSRENWNASTDRYVLNEYDLETYTFLFRQVINSIKKWQAQDEIERMNKLLKQQSVTDELTGLLNRQGYYSIIRSVVSDKEKRNKKYAFVCMDLDHFKYYNDTFGHHVGDAILVSFADIFRKMAPDGANVIRLGGDEFAIILQYEEKEQVVTIVKKILEEIEKSKGFASIVERFSAKEIKLEKENYAGCSIGIAYIEGVTSEADFETVRKNADAALYYVKENGRNNYKEF